ncbi:hypothetical protein KUL42_00760 [Alteromonas sp. KUL42]|nr:hypothetical protein KUL42_00760 [Alteromonas sp. KUL42]
MYKEYKKTDRKMPLLIVPVEVIGALNTNDFNRPLPFESENSVLTKARGSVALRLKSKLRSRYAP